MIVHVLNTFVFLCMVYPHFCAHLCTHMYSLLTCESLGFHLSPYYAFRQGISLSFKIAIPGLERQRWKNPWSTLDRYSCWISGLKYLTQMLQTNNTSLLVWIANTSWLESFAQPPLHCFINGQRSSFGVGVYHQFSCSFQDAESSFASLCCLASYFPALLMPKVWLLFTSFLMPSELLSSTLPVNDVGIYLFLPKEWWRKVFG